MSLSGIPAQRGGEPLRCPTCGTRLIEVERADVLIDACPDCRGVWLDRGELDKILVRERSLSSSDPDDDFLREVEGRREQPRGEPRREEPRYEQRGSYDKDYKKKKKRKSLFEELLDF